MTDEKFGAKTMLNVLRPNKDMSCPSNFKICGQNNDTICIEQERNCPINVFKMIPSN